MNTERPVLQTLSSREAFSLFIIPQKPPKLKTKGGFIMKKRPNNTGSVYFDKHNKKYYASVQDPGKGKRIKSTGFTKPEEAQNWLTEQDYAIKHGTFVTPSKLTLGTWITEYLATYVKQNVRPKTWIGYLQTAVHIDSISGIQVQQLTAPLIQEFLNGLPAKMATSTKHKVYGLLRRSLKKAVLVRLIPISPMEAVDSPRVQQEEVEIFTKDEMSTILTKMQLKSHYQTQLCKRYPFILLAATTGARLGELLGLRWSDFDSKAGTISIKRSMQNIDGKMVEMPPKTKAGYRKIPIPKQVVDVLQKQRAEAKIIHLDGLIFCTRTGNCIKPYNVNKFWHSILKYVGVRYRKFHALRHTHATELLAAGVPIMEVSRRLGHSKPSHTLNLYGHAIPAYSSTMVEKVSELYSLK